MTFAQLKCHTLENMAKLEKFGIFTTVDGYQSILNMIAGDMLNKQIRKAQRGKELITLMSTIKNIRDKASFLNEQKQSYHGYIDACMAQLQSKTKGLVSVNYRKAKKPILFSKQYYHLRDQQKAGTLAKFGSYKYTASELHKKGVLISIVDYTPKQYGGISLTISCNEPGIFFVEAMFLGVRIAEKMELKLDDLLQSQYNKVDFVTLFDIAKVNLNLLIFLINKKYVFVLIFRFYV
jgi:hypothetical protein